jgi:hypothetical protein
MGEALGVVLATGCFRAAPTMEGIRERTELGMEMG